MKELICQKCGSSISLGMMFCPVCGTKPDSALQEKNARGKLTRSSSFKIKSSIIVTLLLVALITISGLLFWPNTKIIGMKGSKQNAKSFFTQMQTVKMITAGRSLTVTINESDINAYLKFVRIPKVDVVSCSVELLPDRIHVRSGKRTTPYKVLGIELSLNITVDIIYKAVDEGMAVSKVSVGHLPVVGKLKSTIADKVITTVLGDAGNQAWLNNITSVKIEDKRLILAVKK
jgi:hypothetical protein